MRLSLSLLVPGLCIASPIIAGTRIGQTQEVFVSLYDESKNGKPEGSNFFSHGLTLNCTFDTINLTKKANQTIDHKTMPFLNFDRFVVMNTSNAVDQGYLHINDSNCAQSKPNALHSILPVHATPAVFRSNPDALAAHNASQFYSIKSLAIKPVGELESGATVWITPWEIDGDRVRSEDAMMIMWGSVGHVNPFLLQPEKLFPGLGWGKKVNWVEIEALSRSGEPLEFCLDDLILQFYDLDDEELLAST